MTRHHWVLLLLVLALLVYECVALAGFYPPITHTVGDWPFVAVCLVALFLGWLAVHFIRAHDRRRDL